MQQAKPHTDTFGRVTGFLILVAGIAMLAFVFNIAYHLFRSPIMGLTFLGSKSATAPPPVNIGAAVLAFVEQIVFLGFMTVIGSLLAGKGISLYLGASLWGETHRHPAPAHSTASTPHATTTPSPAAPSDAPSTATTKQQNT